MRQVRCAEKNKRDFHDDAKCILSAQRTRLFWFLHIGTPLCNIHHVCTEFYFLCTITENLGFSKIQPPPALDSYHCELILWGRSCTTNSFYKHQQAIISSGIGHWLNNSCKCFLPRWRVRVTILQEQNEDAELERFTILHDIMWNNYVVIVKNGQQKLHTKKSRGHQKEKKTEK